MAAENQFVVDLGTLKLTDEQRQKVNAAIQKAVIGELATIPSSKKLGYFPIEKLKDGPIINGIIIRDLTSKFSELIK